MKLITSVEVPLPVVAQKEPVVLEPPYLGRLSRRLPDQDGWCHVSHITLSGRCETWWVSAPSVHGGGIVHHLEPLLEARDREDALHRVRATNDHHAATGIAGALVGGHETAQARGVQERQTRKVEHHHGRLVGLHSP